MTIFRFSPDFDGGRKRREGGESITDVFPLLYELAHACPGYLYLLPLLSKETLWRGKWQPTPVLLPGKSHGQRSLAGYGPWGHKRVTYDLVTEHTHIQEPILIFLIIKYVCVTTKKIKKY